MRRCAQFTGNPWRSGFASVAGGQSFSSTDNLILAESVEMLVGRTFCWVITRAYRRLLTFPPISDYLRRSGQYIIHHERVVVTSSGGRVEREYSKLGRTHPASSGEIPPNG